MAKKKDAFTFVKIPKKKRPGVHSKTKTSNDKSSSMYKKKYRGQGK